MAIGIHRSWCLKCGKLFEREKGIKRGRVCPKCKKKNWKRYIKTREVINNGKHNN